MKRFFPNALFGILLCGFLFGMDQETLPKLEIDSRDLPLTLEGWLQKDAGFRATTQLITRDADIAELLIFTEDLKRQDSNERIAADKISVPEKLSLSKDIPVPLSIEIKEVNEPGAYEAKLRLMPKEHPEQALDIPLKLIAKERPKMETLGKEAEVALELVNVDKGPLLWLARRLLPASAFLDKQPIHLFNAGKLRATLADTTMKVRASSGMGLGKETLRLEPATRTFEPKRDGVMSLQIERGALHPGHYEGELRLFFEDAEQPLSLPLKMDVREGPLWPLLAILIGILLGQLVKYMQERGKPQSEALGKLNQVELRLSGVHPEDADQLRRQLKKLRNDVYAGNLDEIDDRLEALDQRREHLAQLRGWETQLEGMGTEHPDVKTLRALILATRNKIGLAEDASEDIKKIEEFLKNLPSSMMKALPEIARPVPAAEEKATQKNSRGNGGPGKRAFSLRRFLVVTLPKLWAETTYWLLRPTMKLFFLLFLGFIGLNTHYIVGGATFGASPFGDYLALLLWGLSADIAGRTLTNLPSSKS